MICEFQHKPIIPLWHHDYLWFILTAKAHILFHAFDFISASRRYALLHKNKLCICICCHLGVMQLSLLFLVQPAVLAHIYSDWRRGFFQTRLIIAFAFLPTIGPAVMHSSSSYSDCGSVHAYRKVRNMHIIIFTIIIILHLTTYSFRFSPPFYPSHAMQSWVRVTQMWSQLSGKSKRNKRNALKKPALDSWNLR